MRLTVTLDHDVLVLLENAARARGRSKKHIVNEALRQLLTGAPGEPAARAGDLPPGVVALTPRPADPPAPGPVRRADHSDRDALNAALAHYFGLPALPPRLYLVESEG
ncbi:CopG family transcriptional regulator [Nocardia sp. alder85J]|uniref:ribbon-helix-helix domain-containing protein n=1 Tax=Nocardia sp. alder85J TaxID=2862949 RepID=UPI001CD7A30C|nr:CopG family transcriptional regulator [Nocardia sp. alder85J]MCX4097228.1 ribbon-helix-helix domain-containing protein [Nocardia sp. alder85J]